jgi:hypothetical protein
MTSQMHLEAVFSAAQKYLDDCRQSVRIEADGTVYVDSDLTSRKKPLSMTIDYLRGDLEVKHGTARAGQIVNSVIRRI